MLIHKATHMSMPHVDGQHELDSTREELGSTAQQLEHATAKLESCSASMDELKASIDASTAQSQQTVALLEARLEQQAKQSILTCRHKSVDRACHHTCLYTCLYICLHACLYTYVYTHMSRHIVHTDTGIGGVSEQGAGKSCCPSAFVG